MPGQIADLAGAAYIVLNEEHHDIPASIWLDGESVVELPVLSMPSYVTAVTATNDAVYAFGVDGPDLVIWSGRDMMFQRHPMGVAASRIETFTPGGRDVIVVEGDRAYVGVSVTDAGNTVPAVWSGSVNGTGGRLALLPVPRCGEMRGLAVADGNVFAIGTADFPMTGRMQCDWEPGYWINEASQPSLRRTEDPRDVFLSFIAASPRGL